MAIQIGPWTGTLAELVAALESGTLVPAEVALREAVAAARAAAADLDGASAAYALLGRAVELKARSLLPSPPPELAPEPEDPDPEQEAARLAERVAAYRAFAEAAAALREFERRRQVQFGRPNRLAGPASPDARELAAEPAGPAALEQLLEVFAQVWERSRPRSGEVARERFTVAEAAQRLRLRLQAAGPTVFGELFAPEADRLEVVVTFLALLELVRLGEVVVRQEEPFAPVRIAWRAAGGRAGRT